MQLVCFAVFVGVFFERRGEGMVGRSVGWLVAQKKQHARNEGKTLASVLP